MRPVRLADAWPRSGALSLRFTGRIEWPEALIIELGGRAYDAMVREAAEPLTAVYGRSECAAILAGCA